MSHYHVEVLPPRQDVENLEERLKKFSEKYRKVVSAGYTVCITDNAMGNLSFQGTEIIEEFSLPVVTGKVSIHLNTFHTKTKLDRILKSCINLGIDDLLIISGDGSTRLPKLTPDDLGLDGINSVTSVELLSYISSSYPGVFRLGAAFNPYEPEDEEFEKLHRKIEAGAEYIITQPVIEHNPVVDKLIKNFDIPVVVENWMSKKLHLLSDCVGYEIPADTMYDPMAALAKLEANYPECDVYLAMMNYKRQFNLLPGAEKENRKEMKIVVCVKQVPGTTNVKIDPETKRLVRDGVEIMMNPFDTYALEEGLLLKEKYGGEVIVLSMGPSRADLTLREALACGADSAVLMSDRAFGGSDTYATSYVLARGIEKIKDVDLVICGKQAIDGDTAQVGPGIAAHLGWPQATYVSNLVESDSESLTIERMHETGNDICRIKFPAVLTVLKDINKPRVPTLKGRLSSRRADIPVWDAAEIEADPSKIGLNGSPTRVVGTRKPDARSKETVLLDKDTEESAREVVNILKEKVKL